MSFVSPAGPSRFPANYWQVPTLMMLLVQVALYIWMAPRGFEFTDEAYYFHNYLHWREFTGTVTFFGAYFEWPFRAMGMSIAGIRIFSLLLVLASGAVLMRELLRISMPDRFGAASTKQTRIAQIWWYLLAPMASAMLFFGYLATLRAPSYNVLSLFTMAMSTTLLLRTIEQEAAGRSLRLAPLLYGIALGACFLSKATTSVMLVLGHALFFIVVNRSWAPRRLLEIFTLVTIGFAANFIVLSIAFPGWLGSMREGIEIMHTRSPYGLGHLLKSLRWDIQGAVERTGLWLLFLGVLFTIVQRKLPAKSQHASSFIALVLLAIGATMVSFEQQTKLWLVGMAATALGLWRLEMAGKPIRHMSRGDRTELALMGLLFFLPVAFSFGSNMSTFGHSAIASLFPFCAVCLRLYRLTHQGTLTQGALAAGLCILCAPALLTQLNALTDVEYTYRQLSPLGEQNVPVSVGGSSAGLLVDRQTEKSLTDIAAMVKAAGFKNSEDVLDFTGDGPGFIYAIGANPLGTPWMLGGYPGSDAAAARIIEKLSPESVRGAWLLTSVNNPLRVSNWESIVARKVGPNSHRMISSIYIANPYAWTPDAPKTISLQLWKPRSLTTKQ